jgi:hypothetical protein
LAGVGAANFWNPVGWALMIAGIVAAGVGVAGAFNNDNNDNETAALKALEKAYQMQGESAFTPSAIRDALEGFDE